MRDGWKSREEVLAATLCLRSVENCCRTGPMTETVSRSQEASLRAAKTLDSTVREDKMLVNETECHAMVAGVCHAGMSG